MADLLVDPRAGSKELVGPLRQRGLPVVESLMEAGDVAFIGNGPDGIPIPVGIEYKTIGDAVTCMTNGRFAGSQLIGMTNSYLISYLIVEGAWRSSATGTLQQMTMRGTWRDACQGSRSIMYREFQHWLLSMEMKAGLRIVTMSNLPMTVSWLHALFSWWTAKDWEEHRAHLQIDRSGDDCLVDRASLVRPSLARRVALQLPGVGYERSADVAKKFPTIIEMAVAEEEEWQEIAGIGRGTARKVWAAIRGKNG